MAFQLANLPERVALVGKDGSATAIFARWWQTLRQKIETQEATQDELLEAVVQALALAGIAIDIANDAQSSADAIMPDIAPITIDADYTGTVLSGQIPRNVPAQRLAGETDVTALSDWSATTISGDATYTIGAATGILNITGLVSSAVIQITSVYDGITRSKKLLVTKQIADPPPASSTTAAYDSSINSTNSVTYGSANAGILTLTCGASGEVGLSAPLVMTVHEAGAHNAAGKWQYSVAGAGVWTDVDTEIQNSVAASDISQGFISISQTQPGLTPSSDYDFQLLLRNVGTLDTIYYSGTATATTE